MYLGYGFIADSGHVKSFSWILQQWEEVTKMEYRQNNVNLGKPLFLFLIERDWKKYQKYQDYDYNKMQDINFKQFFENIDGGNAESKQNNEQKEIPPFNGFVSVPYHRMDPEDVKSLEQLESRFDSLLSVILDYHEKIDTLWNRCQIL